MSKASIALHSFQKQHITALSPNSAFNDLVSSIINLHCDLGCVNIIYKEIDYLHLISHVYTIILSLGCLFLSQTADYSTTH